MFSKKKTKILDFEQDYHLLDDSPLNNEKVSDTRFGHDKIAAVLSDLIFNAQPPFTIGLFGKWGTGKSTIINLIKNKLGQQDIKTVVFDAWKYESDSLRRQFLINLDEQLKLGKNFKTILNQSLSQPKPLPLLDIFKTSFHNILERILTGFLVLAAIILVAFLVIKSFGGIIDSNVISPLVNVTIIFAVIKFSLEALKIESSSLTTNKIDSAEGFEDIFYATIAGIKGKILIIIDNLDRTTYNKAAALLSDIKTFLSQDHSPNGQYVNDKVVFLIACDDRAIKKHLEAKGFDDPAEFMRKFFNASINMPALLGIELETYIREQLGKTKIAGFVNNEELSWLIAYTYRTNPREIKQFINTLITAYLFAREMEETGEIKEKGLITSNLPALAKLLIIKQKFPFAHDGIEQLALSENLSWEELEINPHGPYNILDIQKDTKEEKSFTEFLNRTNHIDVPSLSVFVRLRQSEDERSIPGLEELIVNIRDKKRDEIKVILAKFTEQELDAVDRYLKTYIEKDLNAVSNSQVKRVRILNLAAAILGLNTKELAHLDETVNELTLIKNFFDQNELLQYIADLSPFRTFTNVFPIIRERVRKDNFVKEYSNLLSINAGQNTTNNPALALNFAQEIIDLMLEKQYEPYFLKFKDTIAVSIKNTFCDYRILEKLIGNSWEKHVINNELSTQFISLIHDTDLETTETIEKKLITLNKLPIDNLIYPVLVKFLALFRSESSKPDRVEQKAVLVTQLNRFLVHHRKKIESLIPTDENLKNEINQLCKLIEPWLPPAPEEKKILYVKILMTFRDLIGNQRADSAKASLVSYIENNISLKVVEGLNKTEQKDLVSNYSDNFVSAVGRSPRIFDLIQENLLPAKQEKALLRTLDTNPPEVIASLKIIKYAVENPATISSKILDQIKKFDDDQKIAAFDIMIKWKFASNDTAITDRAYQFLNGYKQTNPDLVKKIAEKAKTILGEARHSELTK